MPRPCHALTMPFISRPQHGRRETAVLCRGLEKNGMVRAWYGRRMASVNQTRPHCVNQMGKTHSKPLAARHGRGRAWARHAMCESALRKSPQYMLRTQAGVMLTSWQKLSGTGFCTHYYSAHQLICPFITTEKMT
jgi:hypothetical protein